MAPTRGLALNLQQLKKEQKTQPAHPDDPPQGPTAPIHNTSVGSEGQRGLFPFIEEETGSERDS